MARRRRRAAATSTSAPGSRSSRLGHCHPAPLAAAHAQLDRLWHVSNLYSTEPTAELAGAPVRALRRAPRRSSATRAPRRSRRRSSTRARRPGRPASSRSRARSTAARSARSPSTGQPAKRAAFEPLLAGTSRSRAERRRLAARGGDARTRASILLEPVLGEGGVRPLTPGVRRRGRRARRASSARCSPSTRCRRASAARAASSPASSSACAPDLVTLAKALANGLPIGALLVADDAAGGFVPGDHGSTFGGNPVACAAACAVVDTIDDALLEDVRAKGARLAAGLALCRASSRCAAPGCSSAPSSTGPARQVVDACRAAGVVVLSAGERVLRLTPPLTVTEDEVDHGARRPRGGAVVNRRERQGAILRLVREQPISTQSELAEALRDAGYDVVQTTVSRDIDELGLVKVRAAERPARLRAARGGRPRPLPRARRRRAPLGARRSRRAATSSSSPRRRGFASPLARGDRRVGATRTSPARSPARTRSSSSPATARPPRSSATSCAPTSHSRKEPHELGPPSSPSPAGSTPAAASPG